MASSSSVAHVWKDSFVTWRERLEDLRRFGDEFGMDLGYDLGHEMGMDDPGKPGANLKTSISWVHWVPVQIVKPTCSKSFEPPQNLSDTSKRLLGKETTSKTVWKDSAKNIYVWHRIAAELVHVISKCSSPLFHE